MKNEIFNYNGNPITFQIGEATMVNATEMAKPFAKRPAKWLELPSTKEFLSALQTIRKSDSEKYVITINGGTTDKGKGTWMHEDVALEFARWLSPTFGIWCNDRIKEILKYGITAIPGTLDNALNDPDSLIGALTELKEARLKVSMAENKISVLMSLNHPVSQSYSMCLPAVEGKTYTTKDIAKELHLTAQSLNRILESKGILQKSGSQWLVSSIYADKGFMTMKAYPYRDKSNPRRKRYNYVVVWTAKGREFIISIIRDGQLRLL